MGGISKAKVEPAQGEPERSCVFCTRSLVAGIGLEEPKRAWRRTNKRRVNERLYQYRGS